MAHRRTGLVREKVIHSMSSELISSRIFILDMDTSAGTYVKEFVHGDLGTIHHLFAYTLLRVELVIFSAHSEFRTQDIACPEMNRSLRLCRQEEHIRTLVPCWACLWTYCSLTFLASNMLRERGTVCKQGSATAATVNHATGTFADH